MPLNNVRVLGRAELLEWLNSAVEADYTKIEQLADGVAYMQLLDAAFPKSVSLVQLNCNASLFSSLFPSNTTE